MRLKCIKLAGFKSFVDPTTVSFPSNMCSVVGPNGCGKSNVIDAVRWVMGESSAKHLRGESMTDVIFNGSGGRKPVGQASIELVFDNSDGSLGGEYASYAEISVKRKVTRDGQNSYYLNGNKCRRRDITDIFLGTGLGPRSYAIIEQGMISKLIEAKPDELRVYIEEAAGISKYKERRRDTENRMRRTMENLERLTDIRDELGRQLSRLERQAKAAEQYAEFKKEERLQKAQLNAVRWHKLHEQNETRKKAISEFELGVEAMVTERLSCDTSIEKLRGSYTDLGDAFGEVQGRYYGIGAEVARIEQTIHHAESRARELQQDLEQTERNFAETDEHLSQDREKVVTWEAELEDIQPQLETIRQTEEVTGATLQEAEEAMHEWQATWDEFNQSAAAPRQQAEVQQSRIQHLEQVLRRLDERMGKLRDESSDFSVSPMLEEIELLKEQLLEKETELEQQQVQVDELVEQIDVSRSAGNDSVKELDEARSKLQTMRGRHASLDALQQAAMAGEEGAQRWLANNDLADRPRLADDLQVAEGWETAVETVLGSYLQAAYIDQIDAVADLAKSFDQGELILMDGAAAQASDGGKADTLFGKVTSGEKVASLLSGIYAVDDLPAALALRGKLSGSESVITRDGLWLGANWLRVSRAGDASVGMLARKQELDELTAAIAEQEQTIAGLEEQRRQHSEQLADLERRREELNRDRNEQQRQYGELRSKLSASEVQVEQYTARRERSESDLAEVRNQQQQEQEHLSEARHLLEQAIESMEDDTNRREELMRQRDELRAKLDQARQQARHDRDRQHELAMREQSIRTQLQSIREGIGRLEVQAARLQERREQLLASFEEIDNPGEELRIQLEEKLEERLKVERELGEARSKLEEVEHEMREYERRRGELEQQIQVLRSKLEQERLAAQELATRSGTIQEQILEQGFDIDALIEGLPEGTGEPQLQDSLQRIEARISRLGPINLAAIDEYKIESERKTYLDTQNQDLVDALQALENAILKIDRETRTRFKETFDQVNSGIQELFPKVFGGGHAYLELTGEDLLDTGVAIMARPPGKKNSTIHLLSGGEKALTAISLVFSIFRLNPAPFCMLDEVDAPLDDANVGRYIRMVKEMSEHVQFIYITHNKIAMELADQLMGVTMHEPGVSRLVTVDVNEAVELAEA
ncbi:chromosome segregation protein SMC [Porticoccaceae bacterium LTM1]|nr:chromosome segregation protein SMC [Porticoccaceae bacterium LTM1]